MRHWLLALCCVTIISAQDARRLPPKYSQAPVITALRWSPDGTRLAVSGNGEVLVHRVENAVAKVDLRLVGRAERILGLAWSRDGKMLVAGGGTPALFGEVQWWNAETGESIRSARVTGDTVFGASLSPDASKVVVGGADNTVRVLDSATGKELHKIGAHENWVLGTVFSVDGKRFVSVGRDKAAKITDTELGRFIENANTSMKSELSAIARHPAKDLIVMGGEDRYVYIYSLDRTRNMRVGDDAMFLRQLERQEGSVFALDWSPDGKTIAVAGAAAQVNLYDAESGSPQGACAGHSAGIYSVAFSPDGRRLATGGFDGKVRVYQVSDCRLQFSFLPVPLENASGGGQ